MMIITDNIYQNLMIKKNIVSTAIKHMSHEENDRKMINNLSLIDKKHLILCGGETTIP